MKPEIKKAWVKALRSGKYKQGQAQLRKGDRFCCLGVLCDLVGYKWTEIDGSFCIVSDMNHTRMPPLDIPRKCGKFDMHGLAEMNDNGKTFSEIADYIEKNL